MNNPITPERWVNNLMEVANEIADRRMQEERWLKGDWNLWEHPEELIQTVDDCVLDGFIEAFGSTFTVEQERSIWVFEMSMRASAQQHLRSSVLLRCLATLDGSNYVSELSCSYKRSSASGHCLVHILAQPNCFTIGCKSMRSGTGCLS